ncbi:MAG: YkgJ family cysteine cluster protein [Nitrososphaerota archaeon]|nr:YkgJ family cysteine cluster protein [Nitrososphaerota archaeon]
MLSRRYIPWTSIRSWSCLMCGECCRQFKIILTPYDYAKISKRFGYEYIYIDNLGNPCIKKVNDNRCVFQNASNLCSLQPLGIKPLACKMWPFMIHKDPRFEHRDALFHYKGEDYYVYVDRSYPCPGIGKGDSEKLYRTIVELIEIQHNPLKHQLYSTSMRRLIESKSVVKHDRKSILGN